MQKFGDAFGLFLFAASEDVVLAAEHADIDGLVVDWERRGKEFRQSGFDTEITVHEYDDLSRIRGLTSRHIICRINGPDTDGRYVTEARMAVESGADEILVPMVKAARDLEPVIDMASRFNKQCATMIETPQAIDGISSLAAMPVSRMYVGLNDLSIQNGEANIFRAMIDGSVDHIAREARCPVGIAGLTNPDSGWPVPCRDVMVGIAMSGCTFSFLRRSFLRDVPLEQFGPAVERIRNELTNVAAARQADPDNYDREFRASVEAADEIFAQRNTVR